MRTGKSTRPSEGTATFPHLAMITIVFLLCASAWIAPPPPLATAAGHPIGGARQDPPAATAPSNGVGDLLGRWNITGEGAYADQVFWLEVRSGEAGRLEGTFLNRRGGLIPLPEIGYVDGELRFEIHPRPEVPREIHRARLEEGRLLGRLTVEDGSREIPWIGLRPPQWGTHNANGRFRLGTPVQLFDGETLQNWLPRDPTRPLGWTIADGAMRNEDGANNLISRHHFENFRIRAEYSIAEKSNSGIFLRGRYELQIVDDTGQPPGPLGHMALYSRVAPSLNASLPAGQWQVVEATIIGNRLTVDLNGKRVHDNIALDGITGGAIDSREGAPGPIMIQGDHGKVAFRRITVTPILGARR
jgi:hypothetical protein